VLDDDGVDRTPKPLILLKPTVMKSGHGLSTEYDSHTPTSDVSDNFLDRISSSGFGRGGFSASTSGTHSPTEAEDEDDYAGAPMLHPHTRCHLLHPAPACSQLCTLPQTIMGRTR
jgi:hypothetical protein